MRHKILRLLAHERVCSGKIFSLFLGILSLTNVPFVSAEPTGYTWQLSALGGATLSQLNQAGTNSLSDSINGSTTAELNIPTTTTGSRGLSFAVAGLATMELTPIFAVEGGFMFLEKRVGLNVEQINGPEKFDGTYIRYNSFVLPVFVKVKVYDQFSLHLGGYIGLGSSEVINTPGPNDSTVAQTVISPPTENGIISGVSYEHRIQDSLDFRGSLFYLNSLTNLSTDQSNIKMNTLLILAGVTFHLPYY